MKKVFPAIILAFMLVSCFKTGHRDLGPDNYPDGYIRYQLNGYQLEYSGGYNGVTTAGVGVYCFKQQKSAQVAATKYTVMAQLGSGKKLDIVIVADSLKTGSYTTATATYGVTYATLDSGKFYNNRPVDFLIVNISRVSEGTIDGTFAGRLSSPKTDNPATSYSDGLITNGFFQNVAIRY